MKNDANAVFASRMRGIIAEYRDSLSDADIANISEFIDVGEPVLAFETLCTQLDEYEVTVRDETVDLLATIGTGLGLDSRLWEDLRG